MLNDALPSPLLRVQRGETFQIIMQNALPQDLILHWHGLTPPEAMDGHHRLAVPPGGSYSYEFQVEDRAATYWYHSHTHMRTGEQTFRGIAGLLIVDDPSREPPGLPTGDREIPLILQDRPLNGAGVPVWAPAGPAAMAGVMGPEPFGNGIRRPFHDRIMLQSIPFTIPGGMGFMGGANLQGDPLDLLELRVTRRVQESASLPGAFTPVALPDPGQSVRERSFRFTSAMMDHRILVE